MGRSELRRSAQEPEPTPALLEKVRYGDPRALLEIYSRYLKPLQRWARCRVPGWAKTELDTDDVVEKTLLESLDQGGFDDAEARSFQTHLRRRILERLNEALRRVVEAGRHLSVRDGRGNGEESILERSIGRKGCAQYETALRRLNDTEREAIIARFELGLSYSLMALELGLASPEEARKSVIEALLRLAESIRAAP